MTALTMEQRRQDFEAMLKRADLARATIPPCREATTETGGPLAVLARDVAELCAAWADSAARARTHKPGDQAAARARIVAARCLTLLAELDVEDPVEEVVDTASDGVLGPLTHGEDLGLDPVDRVSRLLTYLGEVACGYDYRDDMVGQAVAIEVTALLAARAVCAALAADRGLWQEEAA